MNTKARTWLSHTAESHVGAFGFAPTPGALGNQPKMLPQSYPADLASEQKAASDASAYEKAGLMQIVGEYEFTFAKASKAWHIASTRALKIAGETGGVTQSNALLRAKEWERRSQVDAQTAAGNATHPAISGKDPPWPPLYQAPDPSAKPPISNQHAPKADGGSSASSPDAGAEEEEMSTTTKVGIAAAAGLALLWIARKVM